MKSFEYCVPTRVVFGTDSLDRLPAQLEKSKASRVLVVYGGQSAKKSGLLDKVLALLDGAGISHQELGSVQPNPHLGLAREGVKKAIAMDAQLILCHWRPAATSTRPRPLPTARQTPRLTSGISGSARKRLRNQRPLASS